MAAQSASPSEPAGSETAVRKRNAILVAVSCALLAAAIIAGTFREGQRRGLDHAIESLENHQWAIAIALTEIVDHFRGGYVGFAVVLNKLNEIWYRGASNFHDPIIDQNNKNGDLMNEAIRAAAAVRPHRPAYAGDGTLITMIYSDLGTVDFDKMAFRIFGLRIESFYYMFFLLLSVSVIAYMAVFWCELAPKIVLLFALFSFLIEPFTSIFFGPQMPTFPGMRHGSTLALIPALHFVFLILNRRPLTTATLVPTLVQLAILLLSISIRGSAGWALAFVVAASCWVAFWDARREPAEARTWQRIVRGAARWPVVLLIGGFLLHNQYTKLQLHPIYSTDDVIPYHGFWHAAYIGILRAEMNGLSGLLPRSSKAPEIARKYGSDQGGYAAATEYLRDTYFIPPPPGYPTEVVPQTFNSPWTRTIKFKLDDDVMRRVVMGIWARHPLLSLRLYAVYNPLRALSVLWTVISESPTLTWLWLIMLGGLSGFGLALLSGRAASMDTLTEVLLPVAAAVPLALLPNIWAFSEYHTIADLLLTTLMAMQLTAFAAAILIAYAVSTAWSRRAFSKPAE
jgi:hypothetical protein